MHAQYIADGAADAPLLLLGQVAPTDAAVLIAALGPLAAGERGIVALHQLSGWDPASRLSIEALIAEQDRGCAPVGRLGVHFRCAFRPVTWDQIIGLIAPFGDDGRADAHGHQYLSQQGPVAWIVSTDSAW